MLRKGFFYGPVENGNFLEEQTNLFRQLNYFLNTYFVAIHKTICIWDVVQRLKRRRNDVHNINKFVLVDKRYITFGYKRF